MRPNMPPTRRAASARSSRRLQAPRAQDRLGRNSEDYAWTDTIMRLAGDQLDGLSLHYYTVPGGGWPPRVPAVGFDEHSWADTLAGARRMDELITRHSAVMDKYDPAKRVFLAVDEWGTWYAQDPGSHPGFLRQQNSLRDALVASTTLDIFARHADRVRLSAIAQMVNVLQAMVLTEGRKMVLTPTYHVFMLYRPWQDATVLPIDIVTPWYAKDEFTMPAVSGSAVRTRPGPSTSRCRTAIPTRPTPSRSSWPALPPPAPAAGADRSGDGRAQHVRRPMPSARHRSTPPRSRTACSMSRCRPSRWCSTCADRSRWRGAAVPAPTKASPACPGLAFFMPPSILKPKRTP
jgi:hypothetical protein